MTATVVLIGLAAGTYGLKAAAPLLLSGRTLPPAVARLAALLPAALLAALALVSTVTRDGVAVIDARLVGLAAAAIALVARAPFIVVVIVAAAATALARALA
ncbi:MAG TPA: AzlD domain-containing protein [Acidimicrobiales bacterium]|nr:AzlD domain-containing protein [Acidimicrobiales bacterium]